MKLVLGTRGSPLALWQAETTRDLLLLAHPQAEVTLTEIRSSGDVDQASDLARFGSIGIFTVQVDRAVLDGRADAGVHSMKDMTTTLSEGVVLAGALARGFVEDAFVAPSGKMLDELPAGARVATGSSRRASMVRRARPDLEVVGIRGNVDTRLAKLDAGEADALVMARAGLERLGLGDRISEVLDTERFLPAVGQGIVGWTCRADDEEMRRHLAAITDDDAWYAALAERALLRTLHGGCNVPLGAHARVSENALSISAHVLSPDGKECIEAKALGLVSEAEELGERVARELLDQGAERLMEAARS